MGQEANGTGLEKCVAHGDPQWDLGGWPTVLPLQPGVCTQEGWQPNFLHGLFGSFS